MVIIIVSIIWSQAITCHHITSLGKIILKNEAIPKVNWNQTIDIFKSTLEDLLLLYVDKWFLCDAGDFVKHLPRMQLNSVSPNYNH